MMGKNLVVYLPSFSAFRTGEIDVKKLFYLKKRQNKQKILDFTIFLKENLLN